jgi:hypothetical protein
MVLGLHYPLVDTNENPIGIYIIALIQGGALNEVS